MKAIIATIVALLAMVANAGPFGYEMGQKINEGEPNEDGKYYTTITHDVPAPFTSLGLIHMPNAGLCAIYAVVETDDYVFQFRVLRRLLTDKYGEPTFIEEEGQGIMWRGREPALASILEGDNINHVVLSMREGSQFTGVAYHFTNYDDCEAEAKAMRQENPLLDSL